MKIQKAKAGQHIFNSLGACWLHAMVAIERVHAQCGAKRVTVSVPLNDGRVVYAAFVACDHNAAALRRVVRDIAASGPGASGRLTDLVATDRRFVLPYGGCGESRREAIYWLEYTIEMAVRKPGRGERVADCARDGVGGRRQVAADGGEEGSLPWPRDRRDVEWTRTRSGVAEGRLLNGTEVASGSD